MYSCVLRQNRSAFRACASILAVLLYKGIVCFHKVICYATCTPERGRCLDVFHKHWDRNGTLPLESDLLFMCLKLSTIQYHINSKMVSWAVPLVSCRHGSTIESMLCKTQLTSRVKTNQAVILKRTAKPPPHLSGRDTWQNIWLRGKELWQHFGEVTKSLNQQLTMPYFSLSDRSVR